MERDDFALWEDELDDAQRIAWLAILLVSEGFTTNEQRKGEQA